MSDEAIALILFSRDDLWKMSDPARMMGIESLFREHNTTEVALQFVDEHNRLHGAYPKGAETSFTSEFEILRGDLAKILHDVSCQDATYHFGETVETIHESTEKVDVTF